MIELDGSHLEGGGALVRVALALSALTGKEFKVTIDGSTITVLPNELHVATRPKEGWSAAEGEDIIVGVEKAIPAELALEGLARDIVRRIQDQRKKANYNIDDRILVYYDGGPRTLEALSTFEKYIAAETLATSMKQENPPVTACTTKYKLAEEELTIGIQKASGLSKG